MKRSFRMQLALRATAVMGAAMVAISLASLLAISALLDREIDATILNVAAIQAASLTDQASGEMHFHDWDLTPDGQRLLVIGARLEAGGLGRYVIVQNWFEELRALAGN